MQLVRNIKDDPDALWIGGGDMYDAVILNDIKRFDVDTLPIGCLSEVPTRSRASIERCVKARRESLHKHCRSNQGYMPTDFWE